MPSIFSLFALKREAKLLDSRLYIIKSFMAVITAYFIAHNNGILKLDMISVLFGLMLTLEPVTLTGIRNGFNQLYASIVGALSTAIIVYIFGINIWTVALSIAFTLYVCLKINWREVSPVAIFTSIYMTQYVQNTAEGLPSIMLTFRLRIFALSTGVAIAILFNFLFSAIYYRRMTDKRVAFLLRSTANNLETTLYALEKCDFEKLREIRLALPAAFNNIDWVYSLFDDMRKENTLNADIQKMQGITLDIRIITHLNYDLLYIFMDSKLDLNNRMVIERLDLYVKQLSELERYYSNKKNTTMSVNKIIDELTAESDNLNTFNRLDNDLNQVETCIQDIYNKVT